METGEGEGRAEGLLKFGHVLRFKCSEAVHEAVCTGKEARTANSALEFVRMISAKQQVVAATMYYITLEATDGVKKQVYEAKVWEKPWLNFKELQEFKLVGDDDVAPSVSST